MNKLLTKIVGLSLGLSMAIGVGVAASYSEKDAVRVDAGSSLSATYDLSNSVPSNLTASTSLTKDSNGRGMGKAGATYTLTTTDSFTNVTKIEVNAATNYSSYSSHSISVSVNDSAFGSAQSFTAKASTDYVIEGTKTSGTVVVSLNNSAEGTTKSNTIWCKTIKVYVESSGSVSVVTVTPGEMQGSYKGDAYIQCSAEADGTPTSDVVWTISTDTTYVAEQISVPGASIDNTGKVSFTDSVNVYAFATSTITTTVRGYGLCSGNGLLDPVDYVKVDKTSRLTAGTKVVIVNSDLTYALSTTQNTNNRAATEIEIDETGADPIAKVIPTKVQVFTLIAGVESGFNFSFDDNGTTKYLYANGTGTNNYLKSGASRYANSTDFNISVVDGETSISLTQTTYNGVMQYNSSKLFSCYASASANPVSIFMEGSILPTDVNLDSISNISASNVEVGSSTVVTASYLPTNATENIVVATSGVGTVTSSAVSMSNGIATFEITGDSAGSVTITLTGETTSSATSSITITVTSFEATHTKITSVSSLYNGAKIIFGNFESGLVGAEHTGGNNMPTAAGSFSSDGSAISNSSGSGCEYTMWQLTIKDSEENDVTGWAFYDNGYYLTCATGSNNHWKRIDQLSSLCLFTISFEGGATSIVCADTHVARGTICYNSSNSIFSAYASLGSYGVVDMYIKETSSDAAIMAGFEDFFLMIDVNLTSHGYCTSKHWYDYAKDAYNNTLTPAQKALITSAASARLSAWAAANGDTLSGGSLSAKTTTGLLMLGDETTAITIIVIIAAISITSIGVLLVLKKRKEQF